VYLDVTHIAPEKVKEHFPHIYETCLSRGIDITQEWIPIVPAAHYACGGVVTDVHGRTSIENLYACGEVSCTGVHGANRLASNSLLEAIVYARRATIDVESKIRDITLSPVLEYPIDKHTSRVSADTVEGLISQLQNVMWKYVGIVRTNERLATALDLVREIGRKAESLFMDGKLTPKLLELRNMALTSELIILSAQWRKESRGLHYNLNYPDLNDEHYKRDTVIVKNRLDLPELAVANESATN